MANFLDFGKSNQQQQLQIMKYDKFSGSAGKIKTEYKIVNEQTSKGNKQQLQKEYAKQQIVQTQEIIQSNQVSLQFPLTNQKISMLYNKQQSRGQSNNKLYDDRFPRKIQQYKQYSRPALSDKRQTKSMQKTFLSTNPAFDLRFINEHIHTQAVNHGINYNSQQSGLLNPLQSNQHHIHSQQNLTKQEAKLKKFLPNLDIKLFKSKSIRNSLNSIYIHLNQKRVQINPRNAIIFKKQHENTMITQKTIKSKFFQQRQQQSTVLGRCPCPNIIKMKRNTSDQNKFIQYNISNPETKTKQFFTKRLAMLELYDKSKGFSNKKPFKQESSPFVIRKYGKWYVQK